MRIGIFSAMLVFLTACGGVLPRDMRTSECVNMFSKMENNYFWWYEHSRHELEPMIRGCARSLER